MSKVFYLASSPEFWGSDCSEEQSEEFGWAVAEAVDAAFPNIDCRPSTSDRDNSEVDPNGEIQQWINDHYADIIAPLHGSREGTDY